MNKINIETYENEKKANYEIYIDGKLELGVKGLRYNNTSDLMDEITRKYERYISTKPPEKTVMKGSAKYAGYYEIAQTVEIVPIIQPFTTKELAKLIVDETSSKFPQTHANISAVFSAFRDPKHCPNWLEVVGMRGRSREYRKKRNVPAKEIEMDIRKAVKKAWQ